jgi:hypothetical protein
VGESAIFLDFDPDLPREFKSTPKWHIGTGLSARSSQRPPEYTVQRPVSPVEPTATGVHTPIPEHGPEQFSGASSSVSSTRQTRWNPCKPRRSTGAGGPMESLETRRAESCVPARCAARCTVDRPCTSTAASAPDAIPRRRRRRRRNGRTASSEGSERILGLNLLDCVGRLPRTSKSSPGTKRRSRRPPRPGVACAEKGLRPGRASTRKQSSAAARASCVGGRVPGFGQTSMCID